MVMVLQRTRLPCAFLRIIPMPARFVTMSIAASTLHFSEDDGGFFQVAVCWDALFRSTGGALWRAAAHSCAEWRPV